MPHICRLTILIAGLLLLQACKRYADIKPVVSDGLIDLSAIKNFQFKGKMSFSDGKDGGSGSIQWVSNDGYINTRLKGPLGSKSWRITEHESGATLLTDGSTLYADSAQALISAQLGWEIPWLQLKSWVIGQPFNNKQGQVQWHVDGFTLFEGGWEIEYSRLKTYPSSVLSRIPHKMVARKENYSIKLSIKQWQW